MMVCTPSRAALGPVLLVGMAQVPFADDGGVVAGLLEGLGQGALIRGQAVGVDNTLIFFATDNGGSTSALFATGARSPEERAASGGVELHATPPASNAPFRAGKGTLYEGGVRVPAFAYWASKLKPGVVNEPLHMVDVMLTLLALAGGKGSDSHPFDGKDLWPVLTGQKPVPHEDILINVEAVRGAVRKGNWKLSNGPPCQAPSYMTCPKTPAKKTMSPPNIPRLSRIWKPACSSMPKSRNRASG
jgi:Sulfatase